MLMRCVYYCRCHTIISCDKHVPVSVLVLMIRVNVTQFIQGPKGRVLNLQHIHWPIRGGGGGGGRGCQEHPLWVQTFSFSWGI